MTNSTDLINLKIAYLNILQNIIGRMSNYVLAIKTASITIMTALLAFSAGEKVSFHWWLFLIPWSVFIVYHTYFLRLERAFRNIYNEATNSINIDIAEFKIDKVKLHNSMPKTYKIFFSFTLIFFHLALLVTISSAYFFLGN